MIIPVGPQGMQEYVQVLYPYPHTARVHSNSRMLAVIDSTRLPRLVLSQGALSCEIRPSCEHVKKLLAIIGPIMRRKRGIIITSALHVFSFCSLGYSYFRLRNEFAHFELYL